MTAAWLVQKRKRRAQQLLEEEQQRVKEAGRVPVSTSHLLLLPTTPPRKSRFVWNASKEVLSEVDNDDELPGLDSTPTILLIPPLPMAPPPRDFSALRGTASTHPWRTIWRRNHRLLPQRCEQRQFPKSLPKRTTISAPHADILALHNSLPELPPALPPTSVAAVPSPPPVATPTHPVPPPPVLAPIFPAQTTYGPVRTALALACAGEKACIDAVSQIFDIVWGPYPDVKHQSLLLELPGDQLVFLCMLAEFVALEPVFAEFLHPAIVDFANGWVTHCLQQDSFG